MPRLHVGLCAGLRTAAAAPPRPRNPRLPRTGWALALAVAVAVAGCSAPKRKEVTTVGLNRDTPTATFEYLRAMVSAEQPEAEWKVFSPGFKRRLSQQVGRTVDVADYVQARSTVATNSRREIRELLAARVEQEQLLSDRVANVRVQTGNREARPRFVKLATWELQLSGEGEPVAEFVPSAADVLTISPTGQVEMHIAPSEGTASFLRDVRPDRIKGFKILDYWYLDDFGGVESAVLGGLRGEQPPARTSSPQPSSTPSSTYPGSTYPRSTPVPPPGSYPSARPAPAPAPIPVAPASPDGPGGASPDGPGAASPDGAPPPPPTPAVPAGSPHGGIPSPDGR